MLQPAAKARALLAGVIAVAASALAGAGLILASDRGTPPARSEPSPASVGGQVVVGIPRAGRLLVALPHGWGITHRRAGALGLASPGTCHTATLSAFVDRSPEAPPARAEHLLGYVTGRDFDGQRLWRGTTAGGRGYAVYDPPSLVGVEAVRRGGQAIVIILHGLPTHRHCSAHAAAAPRWELSLLLQNLRVLEPPSVQAGSGPDWTT
jgi:hypothetical protein